MAFSLGHRAKLSAAKIGNTQVKDAPIKGECVYCGEPAREFDHPIPRGRVDYDPDWRVPACRRCNAAKNARTPLEWLAEGLLR